MRSGPFRASGRLLVRISLVLGSGMVALLGAGAAAAQSHAAGEPPPRLGASPLRSTGGIALTRHDLEAFADSMFTSYLRRYPEPSLGIVVVRADDVLLAKGYGLEDARTRRPVDPESTLFHIASVSKLVTATAAMQMVERGRLRLDEDVNRYLDGFRIRGDAAAEPITLWHLLIHTSGLDGPFLRSVVAHPSEQVPLGEYFAKHTPVRGRPPGREIRYSNEGMALAGHLVELASGEPFAAYSERHLFGPLRMTRSSFRQPPPAPLAERVATAGSGPVPDVLLPYPAGSMVSTVADMGRFLRAHLRGGELDGVRILADSSVRRMQARQWRADPRIPGVALGFFESDLGGERGLFHTGARVHFSLLYLLPERGIGIFLVHALRQGGEFQHLRTDFMRAFLARYFPGGEPSPAAGGPGGARRARRYAGVYRPILVATTTLERAAWLAMDTRVRAADDGSLAVGIPGGPRLRLVEIDEGLYRVPDGLQQGITVAFRPGADGAVAGMALSGATQDPVSFERLSWYQRGSLHAALLGGAFLLFLGCGVGSFASAVRRRLRQASVRDGESAPRGARWAWRVAALTSVLVVLCPVAIALIVVTHPREDTAAEGLRLALSVGLSFLLAGSVLGLSLIPLAAHAWRERYWTFVQRLYFSALAVAAAVSVPLLAYYHLLGWWY